MDSFTPMYIDITRIGQWIIQKKGIKMGGDHVEGKIGVEEENKEWVL